MSFLKRSSRKNRLYFIYQDLKQNNRPAGVTLNISKTGMNICVNTDLIQIDNYLSINILPAGKDSRTALTGIHIKKIWQEPTNSNHYLRVGCQFMDLSKEQKQILRDIIHNSF
ncbi:MAG: PilZ domain-containing protein [Spirochaetota bacterium]|nr:PilZ domain-containing protein [Spirochaetota bacterium]